MNRKLNGSHSEDSDFDMDLPDEMDYDPSQAQSQMRNGLSQM
jgi:hypothetical protein